MVMMKKSKYSYVMNRGMAAVAVAHQSGSAMSLSLCEMLLS